MSENWITVIPADPEAIPSSEAIAATRALFSEMSPNAPEIAVEGDGSKIRFFDCGGNFESIACPGCAGPIETEVWQAWMAADYSDAGFALHPVRTPCCGETTTLNDLVYHFPQGFARIGIAARDTDLGQLSDAQVRAFEQVLGLPVRVIYTHI